MEASQVMHPVCCRASSSSDMAAPALAAAKPLFVVDVQHGLCNRLRAMASASAIASRTDRHLLVIWAPDHHCEARLDDLIRFDFPVVAETDAAPLFRSRARHRYNYMEIEPDARFRETILPPGSPQDGDVYVKSAYWLVSPHVEPWQERLFLQSLRPVEPVIELARSVPPRADVAIHVRTGTGPDFDHLSFESPANWPASRHRELTEWRRKSDVSRFIARLDALSEAGMADSIFAASDRPETYAALKERYGARLHILERDLYDRSTRQLQYALADLILLATARRLLASSWSSFSEVAQRLAPQGRPFEQSGLEF
ncbi:MAG: hypothetical protein ACLFRZ_12185 [Rhodosalinus sp.]